MFCEVCSTQNRPYSTHVSQRSTCSVSSPTKKSLPCHGYMASNECKRKNVINATSSEPRKSIDALHEVQHLGLTLDDCDCLTNNELDAYHEPAIVDNERIATEQAIICVICLELVEEETVAQPCQHKYFHFSCLGTWLQQNRSCPLCKTHVLSVRYDGGKLQSPNIFHLPTSTPPQSLQGQSSRRAPPHPRHRLHNARRDSPSTTDDDSLQVRRRVYDRQLFSLYVGNNSISRYRNVTPAIFRSDATLTPRAKRWIRRELRALDPFEQYTNSRDSVNAVSRSTEFRNNEFLLEYIVAILRNIDLKGSAGQAEVLLREHLGSANSRLFLHELENWLRSPFERLRDWDDYVQYAEA